MWHLKKTFLFLSRASSLRCTPITLASRIPLSTVITLIIAAWFISLLLSRYYYHLLCCVHAIGRFPLSLQRFTVRDGNACVAEPASRVTKGDYKYEQSRGPGIIIRVAVNLENQTAITQRCYTCSKTLTLN